MSISVVPKSKSNLFKRWWFWLLVVLVVFFAGLGFFIYKTGLTLNKISTKDSSIFQSLAGVVASGSKNEIKEDDGRTNILLLGMRGANVPGGGLLADTIMVASIKNDENKVALISIPRDLYVKIPGTENRSKINAVYAYGEEKGKNQGMEYMKRIVSEVTGLPIHYVVAINFAGFKQLIDAVGGIDIDLKEPFSEPLQFHQMQVCDPNVFTVRSGKVQRKIDHRGKVVAEYPLCYNKNEECGGEFHLPAGKNHLDGEKALCYVRSRMTSSDYERAKRQQVVLSLLKDKLISMGTLGNFSKVNKILSALGNNVTTDMSMATIKKFYSKYSKMKNPQIYRRVFENSPEGLLMVPKNAPKEAGFILVPRAGWDNYSAIHDVCKNIFTLPSQSDIKSLDEFSTSKKQEVSVGDEVKTGADSQK